jgi:aminoglycoside phosphotransferase (APT) family kinase protein
METLPDNDLRDLLMAAGIPNPSAYRPAEGGAATAIWRVEHAGLVSALRLFHADQRSVQALELEAMQLAHQRELPVPAVRAAGMWRERPFLLLEWCEGEPVLQTIQKQPQQLEALSYQFGRFHAELHRRCQGVRGVALRHTWLDWIPTIPADLRTILERLSQTPTLLHLDYHPLNLLSDGHQITALIDWTNAYIGDPRADLARTYTLLRIEPFQAGSEPQEFSTLRRVFSRNWLRGYRHVLGSPQDLAPFLAWAGHALVYDRLHRVADPNSWWQESHLDAIRSWTKRWENRALKAYASLLEDR